MARITNEKKRAIAERLFINEGLTGKAVCAEVDITQATFSRWRKGKAGEKDWDARRAEVLSAPHKIKEILLKELQRLANGEDAKIKADAVLKLARAMELISGKVSTQVVISVFREYDNWLSEHNPQLAAENTKWHKRFLFHKASME